MGASYFMRSDTMSEKLQIVMIVIEIIYLLVIVTMLKKKKLMLKYSLLWLFAGVVLLVMTIFPEVLKALFGLIGVESPMNGLLSLCIFSVLIILISITCIVSKQAETIRVLTQNSALLEKRVRELEEKAEKNND